MIASSFFSRSSFHLFYSSNCDFNAVTYIRTQSIIKIVKNT